MFPKDRHMATFTHSANTYTLSSTCVPPSDRLDTRSTPPISKALRFIFPTPFPRGEAALQDAAL